MARDLSVQRTDLPVPATLDRLEWHGAQRQPIETLAAALGDDAAVGRIPRWQPSH